MIEILLCFGVSMWMMGGGQAVGFPRALPVCASDITLWMEVVVCTEG